MKDKGTIYLLVGEHGGYSAYETWPVAVFSEQDKAEMFKEVCARKSAEQYAKLKKAYDKWRTYDKWHYRSGRLIEAPRAKDFHFPEDPEHLESDTEYEVLPIRFNPEPSI